MVVKEKENQEQNLTEAAKPHKKVVNKKKFAVEMLLIEFI